jgi:hypothetical protein
VILTGCAFATPTIISTSRTGCEVVTYGRAGEAAAERLAESFCRGKGERAGTGYFQRVWDGNSYTVPTVKFDCAGGSRPE